MDRNEVFGRSVIAAKLLIERWPDLNRKFPFIANTIYEAMTRAWDCSEDYESATERVIDNPQGEEDR